MKKKLYTLTILSCLMFSLVGCGQQNTQNTNDSTSNNNSQTTTSAETPTDTPTDTPTESSVDAPVTNPPFDFTNEQEVLNIANMEEQQFVEMLKEKEISYQVYGSDDTGRAYIWKEKILGVNGISIVALSEDAAMVVFMSGISDDTKNQLCTDIMKENMAYLSQEDECLQKLSFDKLSEWMNSLSQKYEGVELVLNPQSGKREDQKPLTEIPNVETLKSTIFDYGWAVQRSQNSDDDNKPNFGVEISNNRSKLSNYFSIGYWLDK